MNPPDADVVRRLATIRLLLDRAVDAAHGPAPFDAEALSRLHDVIEMWLALAAKIHSVKIPHQIEEYWGILEPVLGRPLGYRGRVQTLNKTRVTFKHYGVEPAKVEISAAAQTAQALLEDETPALFGLQLNDASLLAFVTSQRAKDLLATAETKHTAGDTLHAFADLSEAFDAVIDDYMGSKVTGWNTTIFSIAPEMKRVSRHTSRLSLTDGDFEMAVVKSIQQLERAVVISGLGVDLRRWGRFKAMVPLVHHSLGGGQIVHDSPSRVRTTEDYAYCRNFIITTAVHLAEIDYSFDHWSLIQAQQVEASRRWQEEQGADG